MLSTMFKKLTSGRRLSEEGFPHIDESWTFSDVVKMGDKLRGKVGTAAGYPPPDRSFVAEPLASILIRPEYVEYIRSIRNNLGLTSDEFDRMLWPVIFRYAEFLHQLPASETYHHAGPGGAFFHALEVANCSAQLTKKYTLFKAEGGPLLATKKVKAGEKYCQIGVTIAGLLHDCGKPLTDLEVYMEGQGPTKRSHGSNDESDPVEGRWPAELMPLTQWLEANNVKKYHVYFRPNRGKQHEQAAIRLFERFVPSHIRQKLVDNDHTIVTRITRAFTGMDSTETFTEIVSRSDQWSVDNDVRKDHKVKAESGLPEAIPVARWVHNAIRRIVEFEADKKTNTPDGYLWYTNEGLFLNVKRALNDISEQVKRDTQQTLPVKESTIVNYLGQANMIAPWVPDDLPEGADDCGLYWPTTPSPLVANRDPNSILLWMVKLNEPDGIFLVRPDPVNIRVWPRAEAVERQERFNGQHCIVSKAKIPQKPDKDSVSETVPKDAKAIDSTGVEEPQTVASKDIPPVEKSGPSRTQSAVQAINLGPSKRDKPAKTKPDSGLGTGKSQVSEGASHKAVTKPEKQGGLFPDVDPFGAARANKPKSALAPDIVPSNKSNAQADLKDPKATSVESPAAPTINPSPEASPADALAALQDVGDDLPLPFDVPDEDGASEDVPPISAGTGDEDSSGGNRDEDQSASEAQIKAKDAHSGDESLDRRVTTSHVAAEPGVTSEQTISETVSPAPSVENLNRASSPEDNASPNATENETSSVTSIQTETLDQGDADLGKSVESEPPPHQPEPAARKPRPFSDESLALSRPQKSGAFGMDLGPNATDSKLSPVRKPQPSATENITNEPGSQSEEGKKKRRRRKAKSRQPNAIQGSAPSQDLGPASVQKSERPEKQKSLLKEYVSGPQDLDEAWKRVKSSFAELGATGDLIVHRLSEVVDSGTVLGETWYLTDKTHVAMCYPQFFEGLDIKPSVHKKQLEKFKALEPDPQNYTKVIRQDGDAFILVLVPGLSKLIIDLLLIVEPKRDPFTEQNHYGRQLARPRSKTVLNSAAETAVTPEQAQKALSVKPEEKRNKPTVPLGKTEDNNAELTELPGEWRDFDIEDVDSIARYMIYSLPKGDCPWFKGWKRVGDCKFRITEATFQSATAYCPAITGVYLKRRFMMLLKKTRKSGFNISAIATGFEIVLPTEVRG